MEGSGSSSGNSSAASILHGAERELLRIGGRTGTATLSVLCGGLNEAAVMSIACGDLVLATVMRPQTSFALVVCSVQDHKWLLAHDSAVIRVGPRKFAFAFPHFIYALSLPVGCFDQQVDRFERAIQSFSSYRNHSGRRDPDFSHSSPGTNFWVAAYARILTLCSELVPQPVPNPNVSLALGILRRFITATDIILHALELIDSPHQYITIAGPMSSPACPLVFPSICIIADVVEALRAAAPATSAAGGVPFSPPSRWLHLARARTSCWHFNSAGLVRILQLVSTNPGSSRASQLIVAGGCSECGSSSGAAGGLA